MLKFALKPPHIKPDEEIRYDGTGLYIIIHSSLGNIYYLNNSATRHRRNGRSVSRGTVLPSVCPDTHTPVADAFLGLSARAIPRQQADHLLASRPPPVTRASPDDGWQGTHHFGQLTANIRWRRFGDIILLEAKFCSQWNKCAIFSHSHANEKL